MRRVVRQPLPKRAVSYMARKSQEVQQKLLAGTLVIKKLWKHARETDSMEDVLQTLQRMMGTYGRCMYCLDSHGCDIEHFRPKAPFPDYAFVWDNLLLCCTECGRVKGDRFPLDGNGQPLMINPCQLDPWLYLDFDPDTGNITARFDPATNCTSPQGEATVDLLHLDQREALSAVYLRGFGRLKNRLQEHLDAATPIDSNLLIQQLIDEDDHGLLGWCFREPSAYTAPPFDTLRQDHPAVWSVCRQVLLLQQLI